MLSEGQIRGTATQRGMEALVLNTWLLDTIWNPVEGSSLSLLLPIFLQTDAVTITAARDKPGPGSSTAMLGMPMQ